LNLERIRHGGALGLVLRQKRQAFLGRTAIPRDGKMGGLPEFHHLMECPDEAKNSIGWLSPMGGQPLDGKEGPVEQPCSI
jgi:hypothetical protein